MQKLNTILSALFVTACGFDSAGCFKDEPVEAVDEAGEEDSNDDAEDESSGGEESSGSTGGLEEGTDGGTDEDGESTGESCALAFGRTLGHSTSYLSVELEDLDALHLADMDFTVELWVRISEDAEQAGVYVGSLTSSPLKGWSFGSTHAGEIKATVAGRFNQIVQADVVDGTWHHLAWSYDRQTSKIFVDGRLVSFEEQTSSVEAADSDLYVGLSAAFNEARAGDVTALRLSGVARYAVDFEPDGLLTADAATISSWLFLEGEGSKTKNDREGSPDLLFHGAEWGLEETSCD